MSGRFSLSQVPNEPEPIQAPETPVEIPVKPLISRPSEEPTHRARAGKKNRIDQLAEQYAREMPKPMFSARIPEWLYLAFERKLLELKATAPKITKEAILTDALKLYLGVEEPE